MKPIRPSALDAKNLVIGPLADNDFVKSQRWATLFYEEPNKKLLLQTPHFLAETYGIPRAGPYFPDAKSRAFFKLPFCHERMLFSDEVDYDAIAEWHEKFLELDQYLSGQEFRVKLFGEKNADKYEYQPLVRAGCDPDDEEVAIKHYRPPFAKVKLDLKHDTEVPKFKLFDVADGKRREVQLTQFDDALKYMRHMTKHRFIIEFSRIYAMKTSAGSEKRKYGVVLKAYAVECTNKKNAAAEVLDVDLFDD